MAQRSDLLRWLVFSLVAVLLTWLLNTWGFGLENSLTMRIVAAALCPGVLAVFILPIESGVLMFAVVALLNALYYEVVFRFVRTVRARLR
ncbi:MAG: hypothetical protein EOP93_13670 [Lysobacteraceae bacterium]|nr:MAG: hypothetical protein EOP93_13670 [Xanthomonadaceae bacterium]